MVKQEDFEESKKDQPERDINVNNKAVIKNE